MASRHARLAAALIACVAATPARALPSGGLNVISAIRVRGEGTASLEIVGSRRPNFTTFTMSDPPRLVVDFSEAVFQNVPSELPVPGGVIVAVKTASFGSELSAIGRVLITLRSEVEADVRTVGESTLVIGFDADPLLIAEAAPFEPDEAKTREFEQQRIVAERQVQEEAARVVAEAKAREAEEQQRLVAEQQAQENAARLAAEAEARRLAEAEQQRIAAEQKEAARLVAEAEARRHAEAEQQRIAAERQEAARLAAEAEARRQAEAEQQRVAAEVEARRQAEAEQQRVAAEVEARRQAEAEKQRLAAEAEARRQAEAEKQRLAAEAEKQRFAAEAEARRQAEVEKQRLAAEAEKHRLAAEAEARRQAEERRIVAERLAQQEAARRAAEAEAEERRLAAEAEARRQAEAEQRRIAEREAARVAAETRARQKAEALEQQRMAAQLERQRRLEREAAEDQAARAAAEARRLAIQAGSEAHGRIEVVGYKQLRDGVRIFVRTSGSVHYALSQTGPETIVLELPATSIGHSNNRRPLDTSFFDGPVMRVTPRVQGAGVRLEVTLRTPVPYEARQQGQEIHLDFQWPPD